MGRSHCRERLSGSPVPCVFPPCPYHDPQPTRSWWQRRQRTPSTDWSSDVRPSASQYALGGGGWKYLPSSEKSMRKSGEDSTDEHPRISVPSYTNLSSHTPEQKKCVCFIFFYDASWFFQELMLAGRWSLISQFWILPSSEAISGFQEDELHSIQIPEIAPVRAGCSVPQ